VQEADEKIQHYINSGDWLELNDYLHNSQFEELIKNNKEFQTLIFMVVDDLFKSMITDDHID
jgi:hypothetical protein